MERVRDDEDDPFASLADIEQDTAQALGAHLTVLKKKKMVIKLISKLRSTNLLTLILKLLLLMDN